MNHIQIDVGNNAQEILPVPYPNSPTPSVEKPNYYGNSPYPMAVRPPVSRVHDDLQYCPFLEPSPRNQQLNVPYEGQKDCPSFTAQPYKKDSCYLMDSKSQGVVGIVCNEPGGSDNANFYRGNQFGVDYPFDQRLEQKKLEYTVEQPVQIPLELQNPMIIYDESTFYPEDSYFIRKNKHYLTYPLQPNYTDKGLPTYVYPYQTMNSNFEDPALKIIEGFENNQSQKKNFLFILLLGIVLIYLFYCYIK